MTKIKVTIGEIDEASLLSIANSSGLQKLVNLRRENGDAAHSELLPFSGDYSCLFDSLHGIRPMSEFLDSNPRLYISPSQSR